MGQAEVLNYLKKNRLEGNNKFIPTITIIKDLQAQGLTNGALRRVRANLVALNLFGFVESQIDSERGEWRRVWRVKNEYK